jgi:hypothetical protein
MVELHVNKWILCCGNSNYDIHEKQQEPIEISEQQECYFRVEVYGGAHPTLTLGDYSIKLKLIRVNDNINYYESSRVKCFQNFIGLTHAELFFEGHQYELASTAISVFARKATYDRALSFLKILNDKSDISSICFSVTHMNSDASKGTQNLTAMLKAGIKALEYFQEQRSRFSQFSCSKTVVKSNIQQYNKSTHLDDRSIAYLCSHPESLSLTYASEADVIINSRNYRLSQIESTSPSKDTDVLENQVILAFIQMFLSYLKKVRDKLTSHKLTNSELISFDGQNYLSIDRLLYDSGLILNIHKEKIDHAIENCIRCISFIDKNFPCKVKAGNSLKPTPSQQVLARTHYLQIFGLIKNYYDIGEPQWRGQLEFYGLRNLYKIYEFVCLVNIIEALKNKDYSLESAEYKDREGKHLEIRPINEPCNYYRFIGDGSVIELFYEPHAVQVSKIDGDTALGTLVDLTHYSRRTWTPDFSIVKNTNGMISTHILDAKYSNLKSVRDFHIDSCVLKYTTKMMTKKMIGQFDKVDSMNLLYSGEHHRYESYYIDTLGLYYKDGALNENPLKPILGMLSHNENNPEMLLTFIADILET